MYLGSGFHTRRRAPARSVQRPFATPRRHGRSARRTSATATSRSRTQRLRLLRLDDRLGEAQSIGRRLATRRCPHLHPLMRLDRKIRFGEPKERTCCHCSAPPRPRRHGHGHGHGLRRIVRARLPEQDASPDRGRAAHLKGASHRPDSGAARGREPHLRDRWRDYDESEQLGARLVGERLGACKFERCRAQLVLLAAPGRDERGRAVRDASVCPRRFRRPERRPTG